MGDERKQKQQKQQKPPPDWCFIDDYKEDDVVIVPGIATRVGVTPSTFRKWRMAEKGPKAIPLGKRVAARIEWVDAWLTEQERAADEASEDERPPEPLIPTQHGRARRQPVSAGR